MKRLVFQMPAGGRGGEEGGGARGVGLPPPFRFDCKASDGSEEGGASLCHRGRRPGTSPYGPIRELFGQNNQIQHVTMIHDSALPLSKVSFFCGGGETHTHTHGGSSSHNTFFFLFLWGGGRHTHTHTHRKDDIRLGPLDSVASLLMHLISLLVTPSKKK